MTKKLNFGCGSIQPEGWDNVDIEDHGQPFVGSTGIFDDNTYDIIVAHASIQCTEWHNLSDLFIELQRILKPGGVIRIGLPDIEEGFRQLESKNKSWFPNGENELHQRFCAWLTWYSTSRSLLTIRALMMKLEASGFSHIRPVSFMQTSSAYPESVDLDTRKDEFYFVEAVK